MTATIGKASFEEAATGYLARIKAADAELSDMYSTRMGLSLQEKAASFAGGRTSIAEREENSRALKAHDKLIEQRMTQRAALLAEFNQMLRADMASAAAAGNQPTQIAAIEPSVGSERERANAELSASMARHVAKLTANAPGARNP